MAWLDSSAGMTPSMRVSVWNAASASSSIPDLSSVTCRPLTFEIHWSRSPWKVRGSNGVGVSRIETGGCFGEAAFAEGSRRDAVIEAEGNVTLLKVAATLLEQASVPCQLRFNKVFLRELVERLQRGRKSG